MAKLYERRDLHDGMEGFLQDRGTGEIRAAKLLKHGTRGWCIEIIQPDPHAWPHMVARRYVYYNRVMVEGWRFWDSMPDGTDDSRERWSIL